MSSQASKSYSRLNPVYLLCRAWMFDERTMGVWEGSRAKDEKDAEVVAALTCRSVGVIVPEEAVRYDHIVRTIWQAE